MAKTIKDNEKIHANYEEFQAAYQRAREYFGNFEGVIGVGFGQKFKNGSFTEELCIIVFVEEKKNPASIPSDEIIPKTFEGYQTDVFVSTPSTPLACTGGDTAYKEMKGGIKISVGYFTTKPNPDNPNQVIVNTVGSSGTFGCIVRKRGMTNRENVYLLSNQHVLYSPSGGGENRYVYHPNPPEPDKDTTALGPIQSGAFYSNEEFPTRSSTEYFLDCAIARINIDSKCLGTTCTKDKIKHKAGKIVYKDGSNIQEVDITGIRDVLTDSTVWGQKVFKYGFTTGKTEGFARQLACVPIKEEDGTITGNAKNVIAIEFDVGTPPTKVNCNGRPAFSEHGDSGSVIVDAEGRVLGLLFLGPLATASSPLTEGFISHGSCIVPILDKMNICIPVIGTATMHGTCAATDGSGTSPAPTSGAGAGGGSFGITTAPMRINNDRDAGLFQPEPVTEKQQERLTYLLNAFRSTERGRELHTAFAHVRREVGFLVRNCRPVTVAWHRNKGPGFFACFLNHLRGDLDKFPHRIGEHELSVLLDKMEVQLLKHGSIPLIETIERYGEHLRAMLLSGNDVNDFIHQLEKIETE